MAGSKALINRAAYPGFDEQLVAEAVQVARCAASDDFVCGIRAVLERKTATFDCPPAGRGGDARKACTTLDGENAVYGKGNINTQTYKGRSRTAKRRKRADPACT